jgi:hypothetical protein
MNMADPQRLHIKVPVSALLADMVANLRKLEPVQLAMLMEDASRELHRKLAARTSHIPPEAKYSSEEVIAAAAYAELIKIFKEAALAVSRETFAAAEGGATEEAEDQQAGRGNNKETPPPGRGANGHGPGGPPADPGEAVPINLRDVVCVVGPCHTAHFGVVTNMRGQLLLEVTFADGMKLGYCANDLVVCFPAPNDGAGR